MLVRDGVISDSLHELRKEKEEEREAFGVHLGWGGGWRAHWRKPDKLPKGLSRVINYHPGKGLELVT